MNVNSAHTTSVYTLTNGSDVRRLQLETFGPVVNNYSERGFRLLKGTSEAVTVDGYTVTATTTDEASVTDGSIVFDPATNSVGLTKGATLSLGLNNYTLNATANDDASFGVGILSDGNVVLTPQDNDGSLDIAIKRGNTTIFQNTFSVSGGVITAADGTSLTGQANVASSPVAFGLEMSTTSGSFVDGDLVIGTASGSLVVENATDKVIEFTNSAGNDYIKAYAATNAGTIDGRGIAGFELITGSADNDWIYAGNSGSQLWGGSGTASDLLIGGAGKDIFFGGKNQGADVIENAETKDEVHLNDATLSDIVATTETDGLIAISFNNGNSIAVRSTEALGAAVILSDGSKYRYNHATRNWQSA